MRVIDVSRLPPIAFGSRTTLWWGVTGLTFIEGTVFGLLAVTYFYLRFDFATWPPAGTPRPDLLAATLNVALLLLSIVPMELANRAAKAERRYLVGIWFAYASLAGVGALVLRIFEFGAFHCRWDTNAYGSIVWTILGMHTTHLVVSTADNVLLMALMLGGPVERKHFVDSHVNAIYWYFVVACWVPFYAMLYFVPRL
jgi:cytochrome c oxidase subunit 1/cytochrome c oxidase subunit I+III